MALALILCPIVHESDLDNRLPDTQRASLLEPPTALFGSI